jgi:uncharacterized protein
MKNLSIALCLLLLAPALAAQMKPPRHESGKFVYDYARVLDANAQDSLTKLIAPLAKVHRPIFVITVSRLDDWGAKPGQIENFGRLVYNQWGIGSRTTENMGALIVVAMDPHEMSIEVGDGVTGYRSAEAKPIIDGIMKPRFRADDFAGGLQEAAIAIRDKIFQPTTSEDLAALSSRPSGLPASRTSGTSGDIGLPGPSGTGGEAPAETHQRPRRDERDQPGQPQTGPAFPGSNLHFVCGRWFCIAIGVLVLLSLFTRRRNYGYGYGPQSGPYGYPPPPGYGYTNYGGGGFGGMLGGILTGMLIGNIGRHWGGGGGGGSWGGGGGGVFGGGGGGGDSGLGGGTSSGGGASGSW